MTYTYIEGFSNNGIDTYEIINEVRLLPLVDNVI